MFYVLLSQAPFASPLRKKFGIRTVVFVSGLVVGFSLIAVSLVSSLAAMAVILCLFTGEDIHITVTVGAVERRYNEHH